VSINILLVDDHQMMRDGLRACLVHESDFRVAGEASDGRAALAAVDQLHPDVVVMDVSMPGLNGVEATRQLHARAPRSRVVALSMNADRRFVQAMFSAGAWAYLVKSGSSDELVRAIRTVSHGEKYVSPAVAGTVVDALVDTRAGAPADPHDQLSPREREVLQLIAEGLSSKEVAVRLGVAVSTIETHRKQIMSKLEVRSVAGLTKFAIRSGLTSLE
jgi:DNA-binding NarL/FixJ family response regulator